MEKSKTPLKALPPSNSVVITTLIESVRRWCESFLHLAALEGKKASLGLPKMLGLAAGAVVLVIAGWFALLGCGIAFLLEYQVLSLAWSLLVVALCNIGVAGILLVLAVKRSKDLLFHATRRQLFFKPPAASSHD